ncbi:ethanolaminephosphotransferase [Acrasis kona]|uniref:Ethanolaminephosphotransferase n=1 Tax=Acrasis kona TaxID=1008807 RepID=A0AAW2ZGA4_9EUKA
MELITNYNYLPKDKKPLLEEYKYHGSDESLCSAYLQPFWNYCSLQLPPWLAPNMVTLWGFFGVLLSFLFLIIFSPNLNDEYTPRIIYFLSGLLFFYYQTMDAIDGKHARNTKASSAIGELFDHGLDAITTMVQTFCVCNALQFGPGFFFFLSMVLIYITSYLVIWEDYVTDMLRFGKYNSPTEAILLVCAILCFSGVFGTGLWSWGIGPFRVNLLVILGSLVLAGTTVYDSVTTVLKKANTEGEHRKIVGYTGAIKCLVPMGLHVVSTLFYYLLCPSLMSNHAIAFLSVYALIGAYMQTRMVFARICGSVIPDYYILNFIVPVGIANKLILFGFNDAFVLYLILIFVLAVYAHMVYHVIREMQLVLKINAFYMGPKNIAAWNERMKELKKQ